MSSAVALGWKIEVNRCGSDKAFSTGGDNLDGCLQALQEEQRKIEAFKRELPICMQIITEALEALKLHLTHQQQQQQQQSNDVPTASLQLSFSSYTNEADATKSSSSVLEEFIPSKTLEEESVPEERVCDTDIDKPSWMAQVQLWSQEQQQQQQGASPTRPQAKHAVLGNSGSGAFSPFVRAIPRTCEEQAVARRSSTNETGLTLSSSESSHRSALAEEGRATTVGSSAENLKRMEATSPAANLSRPQYETNSQRKARRCWSPELHRRFLNALQQLGGSHVATPKQIREIMKVDGLTNDEVKSHLQKYRLHTRRPTSQGSGAHETGAQVVVLGGMWASEFAAASLQQNPAAAAFYHSALVQHEVLLENESPRSDSQDPKISSATPEPEQEQEQRREQEQEQDEGDHMAIVQEGKAGDQKNSKQQQQRQSRSSNSEEDMDDGDVTENEDSKK